ncbi:MAG: hypothetical protein KDD62_08265, partial [Bdellovibrionales bacterium]|nr:hypothetical protein [Bdellovibrionales bacterium]
DKPANKQNGLLANLKYLRKHPSDILYYYSKFADLSLLDEKILNRMRTVERADRHLVSSVLAKLSLGERMQDAFTIPFGYFEQTATNPWSILGRSISRTIELNDGSSWSLVFKGAGTQLNPMCPIQVAPQRMDKLPVANHRPLPPQPSWVLRGGEGYHTARSEILNAYGLRAAYSLFGEQCHTAVPLGMFLVNEIPCTDPASGVVSMVDTESYFLQQYDGLSAADKSRFVRFIRLELLMKSSEWSTKKIREAALDSDGLSQRALLKWMLGAWRPAIYGYLVKGDVQARIEKWEIFPEPFKHIRTLATKEQIGASYQEYAADIPESDKAMHIAKRFARDLSRAALYHKLGGDFGSKYASLSAKDITIDGAILDLHANMLAGAGSLLYKWLLHPFKRKWNLENGLTAVRLFSQQLGLTEPQIHMVASEFKAQYREYFSKKPDFQSPYRSDFC